MIMQLYIAVMAFCALGLFSTSTPCHLSSVCLQAQYARVSSTLAVMFVLMHMTGKAWQPILPIQQLCCPNGDISNCNTAGSTGGECVMDVQGQGGPRRKLDVPNSGTS